MNHAHYERVFSFEFFPPKTAEGAEKLRHTRRQLAQLNPAFFSVTYGAGGTTQDRTLETVVEIQQDGYPAAPHLSCIGATRDSLRQVLALYRHHGIRHLVALRGDLPSGTLGGGEFRYASDLVRFVREETGDHFFIEVAAYPEVHPQAHSAQEGIRHFQEKVEAGADSAITQYFYNPDAYFSFVEDCGAAGITVPIVPGIMPIANFSQLSRFSDACGAEIPRWIRQKMQGYGDDSASIKAFGLEVVTHLCDRLLEGGAPGLHFYTMNSAGLTSVIWERLHLT
ncbi:methylenetetrahydrofolate reductase [NAD(P)H] [Ferrovum myxofaciens]|jgi:methylenetetrahydrofolate reductase (NADPH)|uniref:Methylenetetrahydrofolate reductase n=1 Tax=Ferrovum myxofaciens TaxID=416213 RepID=A0A859AAI3_9PROT|nr:methylenetetrahydrofolate reductase [NAD(P)H] [Ferrovum myxofaciens]MBW8028500.1 methylenetetrahydrofolate reductase [NAD(P)H] [Ferrovum sp.]KXW57671.1 5,10-methylenetetrahydrofolate reductase [Ferrovum myxofaciens]MBU6995116.1 methylenetetrahydrofolate reductase [NAD(P)H] [Ferrovum myxofaciens]QKE38905.1 MAG: methylenetetrahydrofolate reductase [NAD(P)H] [Ferrovum myxofaciens]QKE41496.1 MAG: methylenetetrahydrofolate reductase [NAD(P)H] [Ferrovum myxofaciens]